MRFYNKIVDFDLFREFSATSIAWEFSNKKTNMISYPAYSVNISLDKRDEPSHAWRALHNQPVALPWGTLALAVKLGNVGIYSLSQTTWLFNAFILCLCKNFSSFEKKKNLVFSLFDQDTGKRIHNENNVWTDILTFPLCGCFVQWVIYYLSQEYLHVSSIR